MDEHAVRGCLAQLCVTTFTTSLRNVTITATPYSFDPLEGAQRKQHALSSSRPCRYLALAFNRTPSE